MRDGRAFHEDRAAVVRRPRDPRPALRRALAALAGRLGADELRVLVLLATRVRVGQTRYGRLDLRRDARDLRREAVEELTDGLFYLAAAVLRRRRRGAG